MHKILLVCNLKEREVVGGDCGKHDGHVLAVLRRNGGDIGKGKRPVDLLSGPFPFLPKVGTAYTVF